MSLLFTSGSTDKLNVGSDTSLDNLETVTVGAWVYPVSIANLTNRIFAKDSGFYLAQGDGGDDLTMFMNRSGGNLNATSSDEFLTADKWWNVWGVAEMACDSACNQHIYYGDLTTKVAEASVYATRTAGCGCRDDDASLSGSIGNRVTSDSKGFPGRIAWIGVWNRSLSLCEIQAQQFHPHVTSGNVLFTHVGYSGTTTSVDWSGNGNNGTAVGSLCQAAHVPLAPLFCGSCNEVFTPAAAVATARFLALLGVGV